MPAAQWGIPEEMILIFSKQPLTATQNRAVTLLRTSQRPVILREDKLDEMVAPLVAQMLLADAVVFLPLLAKGDLIGVMAVSLSEHNGPMSEARLPLLKGIADQAASAIQNAQLIAAQREEAWVSTALLQVAEAMGRAGDLPETLDIVVRLTAVLSGLDRCTILLRHGDDTYDVAMSYSLRRNLPPFAPDESLSPQQMPLLAHLTQTRAAIVVPDLRSSELLTADLAIALGTRSLVVVPLVANDEVVGAMMVDELQKQHVDNGRLLDILAGIANQAGVAIERARLQRMEIDQQRIATELAVAHNIQKGFLPEFLPEVPGYEIAAVWEPARQVGGDFYDVFMLADGSLGLVVADVADKGVPAALYMALSRTTMRLVSAQAYPRSNLSPAEALQQVNRAILDNAYSDMFVTVYYAVLDPASHEMTYASGGHGLALQATPDKITMLRGRGMVLGVQLDIDIAEDTVRLAAGDYVILYTDGVTDALDEDTKEFGEARLIDVVRANWGITAEEMLAEIRKAVWAWEGEAPAFDDFTLLIVRRLADGEN